MKTQKLKIIAVFIVLIVLGISSYFLFGKKLYCQKYQAGTGSCPPGCKMEPDGGYDPETGLSWWGAKCVPKN